MNSTISKRMTWTKFGACAGKDRGPERGITEISSEEVFLEPTLSNNFDFEEVKDKRINIEKLLKVVEEASREPEMRRYQDAVGEVKSNLYKVPGRNDDCVIKLSGVAEDVDEQEMRHIFGEYGRIVNFYLPKSRETKQIRGFGFVTFSNREEAEMAMKKLQGYGYRSMIWRLEWKLPSQPK